MGGPKEPAVSRWAGVLKARHVWLHQNLPAIRRVEPSSREEFAARDILLNCHARLDGLFNSLDAPFCNLRCGSLCCFFPDGSSTVQFDLATAEAARRIIESGGKRFGDYVRERRLEDLPQELAERLSAGGFIFEKDGVRMVWEVRTSAGGLTRRQADSIPSHPDGRPLWVEKGSRPCSFLIAGRGCSLYFAGVRPKLCRDFICSVCYGSAMVSYLGVLPDWSVLDDYSRLKGMNGQLDWAFNRLWGEEERLSGAMDRVFQAYIGSTDMAGALFDFRGAERRYQAYRRELFALAFSPGFLGALRRLFS